MAIHIRRREFITLLGSAAAAWPVVARAQQAQRVRHVALIFSLATEDAEYQARLEAFVQAFRDLGWIEGRNVTLDIYRPTTSGDIRQNVAEVVAGNPDVIVTTGGTTMGPLLQATRAVPIVFTAVVDPVGGGFVESLAQPGGNATGFMQFDYSLSGKWLELLKQVAPSTTRAAVIRDQATAGGIGQFAVLQSVAPSVGIEVVPINARDAGEIERAIVAFSRAPNRGLIVTASVAVNVHRNLIVALAARHRLPAAYPRRFWVDQGGLVSYGPDVVTSSRLAAGYVDRILKGEKPADLPVQAPTKYELVINLKTAKALGLDVPQSLLARADEVIE
jgi:putative tryptophan/tyrosine transport system substrate-binding protein